MIGSSEARLALIAIGAGMWLLLDDGEGILEAQTHLPFEIMTPT